MADEIHDDRGRSPRGGSFYGARGARAGARHGSSSPGTWRGGASCGACTAGDGAGSPGAWTYGGAGSHGAWTCGGAGSHGVWTCGGAGSSRAWTSGGHGAWTCGGAGSSGAWTSGGHGAWTCDGNGPRFPIASHGAWTGGGSSWSSGGGSLGSSWSSGRGELPVDPRHHLRNCLGCQRRLGDRERRAGFWWDIRGSRVVVEGVDFAEDTKDGGADEYMFIPDWDDEVLGDGISMDDQFAPHTKQQEVPVLDEKEVVPEAEQQEVPLVDEKEVVPEAVQQDVAPMNDNGGKIGDPDHVAEMANNYSGKQIKGDMQSEEMAIDLSGYSQEEEYEPMDDFELEMVRLMLPGFTQTFTKYYKK